MTLNNLPVYDHLLHFFLHPFTLIAITIMIILPFLKKLLKRSHPNRKRPLFIAVLCTPLVIALSITSANADKTTPLLETSNSKSKTSSLPSPAPSRASALSTNKSMQKKSKQTKKIRPDTKLKAAVDPAQATATAPASTNKPKKGAININVKIGNVTNTNGSIKIGVVESKKNNPENTNKRPGRTSQ